MNTDKITVLGGDYRSLALAELFIDDGKEVILYGFDEQEKIEDAKLAQSLNEAILDVNIIVAPLPFFNRKKHVNTPLYSGEIRIEDVFEQLNNKHILLGGSISDDWLQLAQNYEFTILDYFMREELQVLNAIPTAEGALQLAMEKMATTIHGSHAMVLGFGRIGKTVAKMLAGIGADVHVVMRNHADMAWAKSFGYKSISFNKLERQLEKVDLLINTVPVKVLDNKKLDLIRKDTLIIDLASDPGGLDFDYAKKLNLQVYHALGLPGKVAPVSAAKCIKETVYNILNDLEGKK